MKTLLLLSLLTLSLAGCGHFGKGSCHQKKECCEKACENKDKPCPAPEHK